MTVFDEESDLSLSVSSVPWQDPYAHCDPERRAELASEVGLWSLHVVDGDDELACILGRTATRVEAIFDDVLDMAGIRIWFDDVIVTVRTVVDSLPLVQVQRAAAAN